MDLFENPHYTNHDLLVEVKFADFLDAFDVPDFLILMAMPVALEVLHVLVLNFHIILDPSTLQ